MILSNTLKLEIGSKLLAARKAKGVTAKVAACEGLDRATSHHSAIRRLETGIWGADVDKSLLSLARYYDVPVESLLPDGVSLEDVRETAQQPQQIASKQKKARKSRTVEQAPTSADSDVAASARPSADISTSTSMPAEEAVDAAAGDEAMACEMQATTDASPISASEVPAPVGSDGPVPSVASADTFFPTSMPAEKAIAVVADDEAVDAVTQASPNASPTDVLEAPTHLLSEVVAEAFSQTEPAPATVVDESPVQLQPVSAVVHEVVVEAAAEDDLGQAPSARNEPEEEEDLPMISVQARMTYLRTRILGCSKEDFVQKLREAGVSTNEREVRDWESGARRPTPPQLTSIAEITGSTVLWIKLGQGTKPTPVHNLV